MKTKFTRRLCALMLLIASQLPAEMIPVQGGLVSKTSQFAGTNVATFEVGKYEVTTAEWKEGADWFVVHGCDLGGAGGDFKMKELPSPRDWVLVCENKQGK